MHRTRKVRSGQGCRPPRDGVRAAVRSTMGFLFAISLPLSDELALSNKLPLPCPINYPCPIGFRRTRSANSRSEGCIFLDRAQFPLDRVPARAYMRASFGTRETVGR